MWDAYSALVRGAVGSGPAIERTLERSAPLICAGLGVALAFRAGLFNIGAQGQLLVGALAAGYVGFTWDLPAGLHLLAAIAAGMLGGALWGGIVGWLKATTGAHEVITTIMLNYVARFVVLYFLAKEAFQKPNSDNLITPASRRQRDLPDHRRHPPRHPARPAGGRRRVVDPRAQHGSASSCGPSAPTRTLPGRPG